ncbi:YihY/virulence factor BrkB family protein [Nocardioides mesophilus]|uniref:YihY/virulence factor BrkB family protein n=1 Tax=Nocardioides mesophilus TaxID=433659 RepID=A0A7G9R7N8_9ACTN|nr:YihY/virulence factor BrkB family protein [Nocardioides mesophilus]QNN51613.1 YihY/virulence factor BrkB family protein [Nocardioides mesophilus]
MSTSRHADATPAPDDERKPDSPTELKKTSWKYVGRKSFREFLDDQCTDLAAALTYYAVLSIFPAMLALVSLLGLVGQAEESVKTALNVLDPLVSDQTLNAVKPLLENLAKSDTAGLTAVIGLVGAIWSASGYVGAFGRAMNRIYEIREGRPVWKLRPLMLLITVVALILCAAVLLMLVVSGPVAQSIGDVVGLGGTALTVWSIVKWPVLAIVMVLVVALLYYATPNVKQPKFRWVSVGAIIALLAWVVVSLLFALYVANFSSYNKTYGSLGAVIVTLLWLWLTNLALLFGAEVDSELERGRELQAGLPAEEELQLPARDTRNIEKAEKKDAEDVERGRELRLASAGNHTTENDNEKGSNR